MLHIKVLNFIKLNFRSYANLTSFLIIPLFTASQCCVNYNEPTTISDVINTFYPCQSGTSLNSGSTSISLGSVPGVDQFGSSYGNVPISTGDLVLIIQMQGANYNSENASSYGDGTSFSGPDGLGATGVTALNNVGHYEFVIAQNDVPLSGGTLTVNGSCSSGGLVNNYESQQASSGFFQKTFQVVRVPRFANLTLMQDLTTTAWNGTVGGILALSVLGTLDFNGHNILASGKGFRGGFQNVRPSGNNVNVIATGDINLSSGKGEGICGTPRFLWNGQDAVDYGVGWFGYQGGNYGRGAPGNAGGGGNTHNAGGGGGAGYGSGGVGGNGISGAGFVFPNGGRPGAGIIYNSTRLIMGGGGGGGDANNAQTGIKGGSGGGIVFITAGTVAGSGAVDVSGSAGQFGIFGSAPDGAGGGGAGGSIFFNSDQPSPTAIIDLIAVGGAGGNTLNDANDPHGSGGGGGGGAIFFNLPSASVTTSVTGGLSGATNNGNGTQNGALSGLDGIVELLNQGINNPINSLVVHPKPAADFLQSNACVNSNHGFIDLSTVSGASQIVEWHWDFGDGNTSTVSNPSHSYNAPGNYDVALIIVTNFGCRDTIVKQIRVGMTYNDIQEINACTGYVWAQTGLSYTASGIYEDQYYTYLGCDSVKVLDLEVSYPTSSETAITACNDYYWNGQVYTSSGEYTYQTANAQGCDSLAILNLTINYGSTTTSNITACDSYTWINGETYSQDIQGVQTVLTGQNGCESVMVLNLVIFQSELIQESVEACGEFTWFNDVYTASGTYTHLDLTDSGCEELNVLDLVIHPEYEVTETRWTCNPEDTETEINYFVSEHGCDSVHFIEPILVANDLLPKAYFTVEPGLQLHPNQPLKCRNESLQSISYLWNFGDFSELSTEENPEHIYYSEGKYEIVLVAFNEQGCSDESRMTVLVRDSLMIFVPNTFTPDNNPVNPAFCPVLSPLSGIAEYKLIITNRWGKVLFETDDPTRCWDGGYEGFYADNGSYNWVISIREKGKSETIRHAGHVNIIR